MRMSDLPAPPHPPQPRKGRVVTGAGAVVTILGTIPVVLGALLWSAAAASSDPNAGWSIFLIIGLWGFGIPVLMVGLTILLVGRIRARRGDLVSSTPDSKSATGRMGTSIAGIALAWFPLAGFPLALYGFFGNRVGTKARQLGLIGVLLNLVFMYWFTRS